MVRGKREVAREVIAIIKGIEKREKTI